MDPRIRERRIEVQRAMGRRRLRVLAVVASVVTVVGVAFLASNSALLDVDHIQVRGAHNLSAADVRRAAGVHRGQALLFVNTGAVARRIEQLPWVAHATVHRDLPGTLRITIDEYTPAAYVKVGNGVELLASNGRALAHAATAPVGAIEVRGVLHPPADGELLSPPEATSVASQLSSALAPQVKAVDISGQGIALVLPRGGEIRLGSATDLDAKSAAALAVLAHIGREHFAYIDVSTPQTPLLHR